MRILRLQDLLNLSFSECNGGLSFLKATTMYQHWLYDNQISGFYQQFGNITFLTVKVCGRNVGVHIAYHAFFVTINNNGAHFCCSKVKR